MPNGSVFLLMTDKFGKSIESKIKDPDFPKWIPVLSFSFTQYYQIPMRNKKELTLTFVGPYDPGDEQLSNALILSCEVRPQRF